MRVTSDTLKPGERFKVILDGEDVSGYCFMADNVLGEVEMWRDDGSPDPPLEIRRGHVVIHAMHEPVFTEPKESTNPCR